MSVLPRQFIDLCLEQRDFLLQRLEQKDVVRVYLAVLADLVVRHRDVVVRVEEVVEHLDSVRGEMPRAGQLVVSRLNVKILRFGETDGRTLYHRVGLSAIST